MTLHETVDLLQVLVKAYPGSKIAADEPTVKLWCEMLSDLPANLAITAAKRMISVQKFPPTIADIRESVAQAMSDASGDLTAGDAWGKVRKALRRYGYYRPQEACVFLGPDLWHAVEMLGGWSYLCTTDDDTSTLSAQFERRYKAMQEQRKQQVQIPQSVRDRMSALVGADMTSLPGGFDGLVKRLTGGAAQ